MFYPEKDSPTTVIIFLFLMLSGGYLAYEKFQDLNKPVKRKEKMEFMEKCLETKPLESCEYLWINRVVE